MAAINRLLIANRGEIACRIARTCSAMGIHSIAVCSEADAEALHARSCNEKHLVGPSLAQKSYLNTDRVLEVAAQSGADAVHPGYGFMAENTGFAERIQQAGMIWVGPSAESITAMGDKARARRIAETAGVPVVPGSERFSGQVDEADLLAWGRRIGYPLLVKASAGGGGIGMNRVDSEAGLIRAVQSTQGLARANFGDDTVFFEKFIPRSRHIEVQILGFGDGRALHLFERECSIQRRYQKIIEEAPSPVVDESTREQMTQAAVALAESQRYAGAGTVEFILDDDTGAFYFLEMNTRIQVEHPVTEMVTGEDIVAHQLRIAAGDPPAMTQADVTRAGHAIELRLYAEDPASNFLPQPGTLEAFSIPVAPGEVRLDAGYEAGSRIPPYYDPMIAKLIVRGEDRQAAIERAEQCLAEATVEGIRTNLPFLRRVLAHPAFRRGETLTSFISDFESDLLR